MKTNTETTAPVLPATLELEIVAKWLEEKQHKFTLRLKNTKTGGAMVFPYSGGCMAFLPKETPQNKTRLAEIRKGLAIRVRTLWDEEQFNTALNLAHNLAKPDLAGVLHSLLSDMDAGAESFKDFCDNYGYDTDSRKAYKTWQDCQEHGADFKRVARPHLEEIREALADY